MTLGFCSAPGAAACWACGAGGDALAAVGAETGFGGVSGLIVVWETGGCDGRAGGSASASLGACCAFSMTAGASAGCSAGAPGAVWCFINRALCIAGACSFLG